MSGFVTIIHRDGRPTDPEILGARTVGLDSRGSNGQEVRDVIALGLRRFFSTQCHLRYRTETARAAGLKAASCAAKRGFFARSDMIFDAPTWRLMNRTG